MDKDYYKILEVRQTANEQEIKKAYRQLVMKLHPDRNEADPAAEDRFRQVQEAYEILSNPGSRSSYNQQRWFRESGSTQRNSVPLTSYLIFHKSKTLTRYLSTLGDHYINRPALRNYIRQLLKDSNINSLVDDDRSTNVMIIDEFIQSTRYLSYNDTKQITPLLIQLAADDSDTIGKINEYLKKRKLADYWNRYLPLIVLVIAIILCVLIYVVSNAQAITDR